MPRTILVGDVHGCAEELEALLARVAFAAGVDSLVFVGDLVVRGPDPRGVLAVVRRTKARAVLGNHEARLLAGRRGERRLGAEHAAAADALTDDDWDILASFPLWLDLPEHDAVVVHAGVIPGVPVSDSPAQALLTMRTVDAHGGWSDDADAGPLWGSLYVGPPHVVFGHNAREEPQLHAWATGIDTGCVYGGALTALVLARGERVPRGADVRRRLVSVAARRVYYGRKGGPLPR